MRIASRHAARRGTRPCARDLDANRPTGRGAPPTKRKGRPRSRGGASEAERQRHHRAAVRAEARKTSDTGLVPLSGRGCRSVPGLRQDDARRSPRPRRTRVKGTYDTFAGVFSGNRAALATDRRRIVPPPQGALSRGGAMLASPDTARRPKSRTSPQAEGPCGVWLYARGVVLRGEQARPTKTTVGRRSARPRARRGKRDELPQIGLRKARTAAGRGTNTWKRRYFDFRGPLGRSRSAQGPSTDDDTSLWSAWPRPSSARGTEKNATAASVGVADGGRCAMRWRTGCPGAAVDGGLVPTSGNRLARGGG